MTPTLNTRHGSPNSLRLTLSAIALFAIACRSGVEGGGADNDTRPPTGAVSCPGSGLTVCDLKFERGGEKPALDSPITLVDVIVTTPTITVAKGISGFFVQDQATNESLDGQYSGVLVTYGSASAPPAIPSVLDVVTIEGLFTEFGREGFDKQKQVNATRITSSGRKGTVEPVVIDRAEEVKTGGEKSAQYEGVLVQLKELTVSSIDVMVNEFNVFGAFQVNQSLYVSGALYDYRHPTLSEQFTSITGVLRLGTAPFEAGQYFLTPRFQVDIVPKNTALVVTKIQDIQDPTSTGRPLEMCKNVNGMQTVGKCAVAKLSNVVVTAVGGYVSKNLRALYVQDDSITNGRFSGVKVVYNSETAQGVPERGQRVDVEGEIIEYRRGMQIQYPTFHRNGASTTALVPIPVTAADIERRQGPEANPYEGVLVRVDNVRVTDRCLEDGLGRDHGNWVVGPMVGGDSENVYVGTEFEYTYNGDLRPSTVSCLTPDDQPTGLCGCDPSSRPNDERADGDEFRSIAGVTDFSFNEFTLQPRDDNDLAEMN